MFRFGFQIRVGLLLGVVTFLSAQTTGPEIDHTCTTCSRRTNDSINVFHRRRIRVNQVGYLPAELKKTAFVANAAGNTSYQILDLTGRAVYTGTLSKLGEYLQAKTTATSYLDAATVDYTFSTPSENLEALYEADFSSLKTLGRYRIVQGGDTSAAFLIDPKIYHQVLDQVLAFFGANRCGKNPSWLHAACHLKDGSALGAAYAGQLAGGWHDCGDHGKYGITTAYTAMVLSLANSLWPKQSPALLAEAKVGADYIFNLYTVSKDLGLVDSADMIHSIGSTMDHAYWDVPENQDKAPLSMGGADRPVLKNIGSEVSGSYSAALAFFSQAYQSQDSIYANKLKDAAIDIYDHIVLKKRGITSRANAFYPAGFPTNDDEAMAALALWIVTKDPRFGYDLLENPSLGRDSTNFISPGEFPAGLLFSKTYFLPGGWTTDYANTHPYVLYALAKLVLPDVATAASYGVSSIVRDSLLADIQTCLALAIKTGSSGKNSSGFPGMAVDEPYHGVFTGMQWGYNRYNMGAVIELFMYYDLTRSPDYRVIGVDNLNFLLGANSYDMSFITGCGDRNLQHPHHRAANPEGYNQGGTPYAFHALTGGVMGGVQPGMTLKDQWLDYTTSETCLDFASQVIFPLMILSQVDEIPVSIGAPSLLQARPPKAGFRRNLFDLMGRMLKPKK